MKNNQDTQIKRAVIYCRVSTGRQVEEGTSLTSQERICREYAQNNGYEIEHIFIEKGESAKTADRTELNKMLKFCTLKKNQIKAVVFYKIDRLSRNKDDYGNLRILLKKYGVEVKSATEHFDDTPTGRFMEGIISNIAQFDNDVRTERTIEGMKEAVREGRYVWGAPIGYDNSTINGRSNLVQNSKAKHVLFAFEEVVRGVNSIEQIRISLKDKLTNSKNKPICKSQFYRMLKNETYAGRIKMGDEKAKSNFKAIVQPELFDLVQKILINRRNRGYTYNIQNPDFPLRNHIRFGNGDPLVGAWCKGRIKKYPYYWFRKNHITFRKEHLEYMFSQFLDKYKILPSDLNTLKFAIAVNVIKKQNESSIRKNENEKKLNELKELKEKLILKNLKDVISDVDYKEQVAVLDNRIFELEKESISNPKRSQVCFDQALTCLSDYFESPGTLWLKSPYQIKLKLQRFNFPQGVVFDFENCRTTKVASIYKDKKSFFQPLSHGVTLKLHKLNQQFNCKRSYKWLNFLPRGEIDKELFWNKVYDEIIELAELLNDKMVEDT